MNDHFELKTVHHMRRLVDHVPAMLAYWDRELRCCFANRAYERWFGALPGSLIGSSIQDLMGPELFSINQPHIRAALQGQEQVFERVSTGPGGERRHNLATYVPDIDGNQVLGFIAYLTEVTQLKEVESALRCEVAQREQHTVLTEKSVSALRLAQHLGQIGSWSWDPALDITTWSEELYNIFGLDSTRPPPTLAQHPALYEEKSWARLKAAVSRALETGEPYTLELEYMRSGGEVGWLEARGEAVRGESNVIGHIHGTVQEISLRVKAEKDRVRLQVVEEANKNKNALLTRVSHELRTPLNAIMGFAQLCQNDLELTPRHQQWAQVILASGQHMLELVNEMLDLSAAESGHMSTIKVDVDLVALVRSTLVQFAPAAAAAEIRLLGPPPQQLGFVRSDPTRLKQVIDNLVSNAIKYNRLGGTVTVNVVQVASTIDLSVSDTGVGLSDEQMSRLFLPFERLGAEQTKVVGTGIGLALTKSVVALLGGEISVKSQSGIGSTFSVQLPVNAAADATALPSGQEIGPAARGDREQEVTAAANSAK